MLRSALTGRFISSKRLTLHSPGTALRSVATGRFIYGGSANDSKSPAIDRTVRSTDNSVPLSSRHILCNVCRGYGDDRWYPRCHTRSYVVQITGVLTANKSTAEEDEWSETSTVEVVTVRNKPMTPIPRHSSDNSSEGEVMRQKAKKTRTSTACVMSAMTRYRFR